MKREKNLLCPLSLTTVKVFALLALIIAGTTFASAQSGSILLEKNGVRLGKFTSGADGFNTNAYWIEGRDGIIVFDTQFLPDIADQLVSEIRRTGDKPIRYAVNLHANPDKFNGNGVFAGFGAELITNRATRAAMPTVDAANRAFWTTVPAYANRYPTTVPFPEGSGIIGDRNFYRENSNGEVNAPLENTIGDGNAERQNLPFNSLRVINLGNVQIYLIALRNEAVSVPQTISVVRIGRETAVIVGDLVSVNTHAWLQNGTPYSWIKALREVQSIVPFGGTVYPGRGNPAAFNCFNRSGALAEQKQYLNVFIQAMNATEDLANDRARRAAEVKRRLIAAFPTYQMPELIDFSFPNSIR